MLFSLFLFFVRHKLSFHLCFFYENPNNYYSSIICVSLCMYVCMCVIYAHTCTKHTLVKQTKQNEFAHTTRFGIRRNNLATKVYLFNDAILYLYITYQQKQSIFYFVLAVNDSLLIQFIMVITSSAKLPSIYTTTS